jgi:hypothetical protein
MSLSPNEKYPGATEADPNYKDSKFKDNNPSTTNNGSPLKALDRNEQLALQEAMMNAAGFDYNGVVDTPQNSQMFNAYKAALSNGANLLSNHNFIIASPDDSQPAPSATPTSYPPGYEIFSGVFANETTGILNLTYIDGRVSFSGGDFYIPRANSKELENITEFVASVADFDGKPRTRGVSFSLVGDEYRVTVGVDALEDTGAVLTPLGSVKFEQGSVATGHEVDHGIPIEYQTQTVKALPIAVALPQRAGYVRTESRGSYGGGALYSITDDTPNGFDKIIMDNGKTLTMIKEDKYITLEQLGAEPRDDFDTLPVFNFARDNYQFVTTENSGVFYTSDELIPTSGMVFISETSSNATAVRDLELAVLPASLINPSNWVGKAVFRASLTPIGGSLGGDLSGCEFGPFDIDAEGADYAFYSRYLTNESRVRRITSRNSNVCNICVLTTWFAKYDGLTSMRANGKGVSLGYALSGEAGDIAVNAIEFENVRANFSGQSTANQALWVDGVDVKANALNGAGVILNTNACNFPTLQAEKGVGVGLVDISAFNNSFGTIYTEGNCSQMTTGRADFVGKNSGTGKVVQAQNVFIGSTGDNAYYLEPNVLIDAGMTTRNSADNTFYADEKQVIMRNSNSLAFANQDESVLASDQFTYSEFYNLNMRYSSQLDNSRFFTDDEVSFPYVVVVPRGDYSLASNLAINIDGNTSRSYGTEFTEGAPILLRHAGISSGAHKVNVVGTLPTSDFFCDVYIMERRPSAGFTQVR